VRAATRLQELTEGQVPVGTEVVRGGTVDEVSRLSQSAHMVVLEHRHLGRLHRVFTGSVSSGVAARSSVEVAVVPELWQPSKEYIKRVLVGVGNWHAADRLFQHAFEFAAQHEAQLKVLHAWDLPSVYEDALVDEAAVEQWRHDLVIDIEAAFADAARQHPAVKATVDVVHARPADALLEASREADVLQLGRHEVRHPLIHQLGSMTRAMLQVAECPVVVVPVD
jgi:nucleotide-binding universal stress UspA family protein